MNKKGRILRSICFPVHLAPIIDKLSASRTLSSTISELLWSVYGNDETDQELIIIKQMEEEAERLLKAVEMKKNELGGKIVSNNLKSRLSFLETFISDNNSIFKTLKGVLKDKGYYITANNERSIIDAKKFLNEYKINEEDAIKLKTDLNIEISRLKNLILNPKEDDDYNYNNNNNIYYLIKYNNI